MKKYFSFLCLALLVIVLFPVHAKASVSLNKTTLYLVKDTSETLKVSGTDKSITWSSADKSIATVSSKGKVTGVDVGETTIKAKYGSKTLKCKVVVMRISYKNREIVPGATKTLSVKNSVGTVTWKTADNSIATVSSAGVVTGIASGTTTITAKCQGKSMTCKVYVPKVTLENKGLKVGGITKAALKNNYYDNYKFSSSDTSVATVDSKGNVKAKKLGTAKIIVKTYNSKNNLVSEISKKIRVCDISDKEIIIGNGSSKNISILNASDIVWTSSDSSIVKVDSNGKVTAVNGGECTVTGTVYGLSFTCKVYVPSMDVDKTCYKIGDESHIRVEHSNRTVTYSSSNASVVLVDTTGKISAVGKGHAYVTAKTSDEKGSAIEFKKAVTVSEISEKSVSLKSGEHYTLTINDAVNVVWLSSNDDIASVNSNGTVTAKLGGSCVITGICDGMSFSCDMNVYALNTTNMSVSLDSDGTELYLVNFKGKGHFTSNDDNIAVYKNGKVIPVSLGSCQITCEADGITNVCDVTVKELPVSADRFIRNLEIYSNFIKENRELVENHYDSSLTTFKKAQSLVANNQKIGITCVVPIRWSLTEMGVKRADGKSLVSGDNASFKKCYTGDMKTHLTRITSGGPIGMTVKEAVDQDLLKKGDILCNEGQTHTYTYSGKKYYVFEGGGICYKAGLTDGVRMDYSKGYYKTRKISEILRWKVEK